MDRWATAVIIIMTFLVGGLPSHAESKRRIEVFHTAADPIVVPPDVVVVRYIVDGAVAVENALTARFVEASRTVSSAARRHYAKHLVRQVQPEVTRAVVNSYQGLHRARALGITRVPVIVFDDGAAVIYGVRDLREALSRYRQWAANQ